MTPKPKKPQPDLSAEYCRAVASEIEGGPAADRDRNRGVYRKFVVKRTDGGHRKGRKHAECSYFVLDLAHDEFAAAALRAYAKACKRKFPELARDIGEILAAHPCGCRSVGECMHRGPQTPSDALASKLSEQEENRGIER